MKLNNWFKKSIAVRLVIAIIASQSTIANTMVDKQPLPKVDLKAYQAHSKELSGNKKRTPASFVSKSEKRSLRNAITSLVLEETQINLPEKERIHSNRVAKTILEMANKYEMDPLFLVAIIRHESHFNPNQVGLFKEEGLMQIKPDTAEWLNKKLKLGFKKINLFDPVMNIKIGAAYLNYLRNKYSKNSIHYVAAYNMGPKNLQKLIDKNQKPKEYGEKVMKVYLELNQNLEILIMREPFPKIASK